MTEVKEMFKKEAEIFCNTHINPDDKIDHMFWDFSGSTAKNSRPLTNLVDEDAFKILINRSYKYQECSVCKNLHKNLNGRQQITLHWRVFMPPGSRTEVFQIFLT